MDHCFELLENVMSVPPNLVRQLSQIMLQWSPLWLATTAVTTALGFAYVVFYKEDVWVASQAIIVRDEISGTVNRQGRFDNKESLKAALDTILEIARNPQVVQQALKTQLPADTEALSEKAINDFIDGQLTVRSPKGSEFGSTEIFYVDVRHSDKLKAVELNTAICDSLEKRLQEIRMSRYDGIRRELEYALDIAIEQRTTATEQLKKIENAVGDNLTDLRSLTDSPSAGGTAKSQLDQLTGERRQVEVLHRQLQEDLRFLQSLENDPSRVLVAPSNILNTQPGLRRLCEGLVDSQIQEFQLSGRYTSIHPAIQAAQISREAIRQQLGAELKLARVTLETEIKVSEQRIKSLDDQIKQSQSRIAELAEIRADYANILGEVRNRSSIIEQIERDLSVAEANRRVAMQSSLVSRIDSPVLSDKPIGPGTKVILLASVMAGFLTGLGLILLLAPIDLGIKHGRRWSDHIYATNQAMARNHDTSAPTAPTAPTTPTATAAAPTPVPESTSATTPAPAPKTTRVPMAIASDSPRQPTPSSPNNLPTQSRPIVSQALVESAPSIQPTESPPARPVATAHPATSPRKEAVSYVVQSNHWPSSLAMEIEPPAAVIRTEAINTPSHQPTSSVQPSASPETDNRPENMAGVQNGAGANASEDTASGAGIASERRTRPRQSPAAIFTNNAEQSNFGFTDSAKLGT